MFHLRTVSKGEQMKDVPRTPVITAETRDLTLAHSRCLMGVWRMNEQVGEGVWLGEQKALGLA